MSQLDRKLSSRLKKLDLDEINNNHVLSDETPRSNTQLFDNSILAQIKEDRFLNKYDRFLLVHNEKENIYYFDLGDNLILRPLKRDDFAKGYLNLLAQLTVVGDVSKEQYEQRFDKMKSCYNTYFILVVEDLEKSRVCATITHVYEQKFLRNTSSRGRIEDVVVDEQYRGKKLSKLLLDVAVQLSKLLGCYKLSLECKDHLKKLYQQFGFDLEEHQNYLCQRFI
jgi:glucosamine-phosphate N-acetyltransferase